MSGLLIPPGPLSGHHVQPLARLLADHMHRRFAARARCCDRRTRAAIKERDAERAEKAKLAAERDRLQALYEHVHHLLRKENDHRFGARAAG
jgi:hypothetical protein